MPRNELRRQSRKLVSLVLSFMKKEAEEGLQYNLKMVQKRTAAATGVSLSTVRRISAEAKNPNRPCSSKGPVFRTPGKKRTGKKKVTGLDSFDLSVIKRCVHNFHKTEKELPTINLLLKKLKEEIDFKGSATSLRTVLKRLGFKWRRTEDKRKLLIERTKIRLNRIEYLKKLTKYRQEGRPIIYTHESYVDFSHKMLNSRSDSPTKGLKGQRVVVALAAGSETGFIPNALLLFNTGTKTDDYHCNMNNENYERWLRTKLIPNLPEHSVVVVDNASYHKKLDDAGPTSSSSKSVMEAWLRDKNISYSPSLLKAELYELICCNKEKHEKYFLDNILHTHNHSVLRVPPNHPDLNPIKMAWADIKGYLAQKKLTGNIDEIMKVVEEKVNATSEPEWSALCIKVREIEEEYEIIDLMIDQMTEEFIIQSSDNESSNDSETESEDCNTDEMDMSSSSDENVPSSSRDELMPKDTHKPRPVRRIVWLKHIGREDLLNVDDLKHYSYEVCSDHFQESDMKTIRQLHPHVVPSKIISSKDSISIASKESKSSASTSGNNLKIVNVCSLSETLRKHDSGDKEGGIRNNISKQNSERFVINPEYHEQGDTGEDLSEKFQMLFNLRNILRSKFKGKENDAYKKFTLKLHFSSPHMYTSLQPWLKLPSKVTLSGLKIVVPPKLDAATLEILTIKIKSLPAKAKYCSICVDEIELKPNLFYDLKEDEMFGFEIKGDVIFPANYAYVIMLQSFYFDWKQPIMYEFCATAKTHAELDVFITDAVTNLFSLDISIIGLITNEKQIFQQYAAAKKVTIGRPYFFINGRIIYYIFDVPSLLKCLHLDLITTRFYDSKNKQIWWEFIKYIYLDQQRKKLRLTPKLTLDHIQPDAKKMTVEQSAQIFSNSVSSALETYIAFDAISEEAKATATFIKNVNDLFDVLNSDKGDAEAGFTEDQAKILGEGYTMFSNMKTSEDDSKDIKTCQLFLVTIQSMQHLFEELKVDRLSHFNTRRLNQDCIVDLLKSARKGEANPTPMQLTRAFSKCFLKNMLQNNPCRKLDTNETFKTAEDVMRKEIRNPAPHKSLVSLQGETDYRLDLPKNNALIYVACYLLFKCSEQHDCSTFQRALKLTLSLEGNNLFNTYEKYNKQASFYGKLRLPAQEFIQYICKLEAVLHNNFKKHIDGKLGSSLFELLNSIPKYEICPCFPSEYLIKLFIRLRIYDILHFNNDLYTSGRDAKTSVITIKKLIV